MNKRRLLLFLLLILTAVVLAGTAGFYLLLPSYLEQRLLPGLAARLGVEEVRGRVCRLGLSSAELLDLTAGAAGEPALSIRTARLDYTLSGLLGGRLTGVEISGFRLRLAYRDGTLVIPGMAWPQAGEGEGKEKTRPGLPVGSLEVEDGELLLALGQQSFRLPFVLSLRQEDQIIAAEWRLFPCGQEFFFQAQADPATGEAVGSLRTEHLAAASLAAFPLWPPDMHPDGTIALRGSFRVDLASLAQSNFTVEGIWRQAMLVHRGVIFRAAPAQPLTLTASGTPGRWHLALADLSLVEPRPLAVPALDVEVKRNQGRFEGSGRFRLRLHAFPEEPVTVLAPLAAMGEFAGTYAPGGSWQFELDAGSDEGAEEVRFRINDVELGFRPRALALSGEGQGGQGEVQVEAVLTGVAGQAAAVALRAPEAVLTGRFQSKGSPVVSSGDFSFVLTGLVAETADIAAKIERAAWRGDFATNGESCRLESVLRLEDSGVSLTAMDLQAEGIAAEIPFTWPPSAAARQGNVTVAGLAWAGKSLGPVTAALRQQGRGYRFDVVHTNRLLGGLRFMLAGTASFGEEGEAVEAKLTVPRQELKAVSLARLHPAAAGLTLAGELEAAGRFALAGGRAASTLRAVLGRGILEHPEKKWRVEGIETAFILPDLLALQSDPGLRLELARAALGGLRFGEGRLGYQLEAPGSLLIEESEIAWSGGHLRLYGLRLAPDKEEHDLVIYCDGVRVPDILAQLGVAEVHGEGAVSGRIPLTLRNGGIRFGEGFLASTPGRGGFLKVTDPRRLAAVIPEAARAGQIDFALEALRNFEYDWVKLHFGSKGQDLIIQMQLNGKPAEPLPFTFDRELGSFVRLKGEGRAGIMQPIRLDINFRLPLDDLLLYGAGFQKLFEN